MVCREIGYEHVKDNIKTHVREIRHENVAWKMEVLKSP
jgi:hypothetical protein